jgi:hypothetical protein
MHSAAAYGVAKRHTAPARRYAHYHIAISHSDACAADGYAGSESRTYEGEPRWAALDGPQSGDGYLLVRLAENGQVLKKD